VHLKELIAVYLSTVMTRSWVNVCKNLQLLLSSSEQLPFYMTNTHSIST